MLEITAKVATKSLNSSLIKLCPTNFATIFFSKVLFCYHFLGKHVFFLKKLDFVMKKCEKRFSKKGVFPPRGFSTNGIFHKGVFPPMGSPTNFAKRS